MKTLRKGDKGDDVCYLQICLKALEKNPGDIDGLFGPHTFVAVKDFQDDHDELEVDGIVGPQTWGWIHQALEVVEPTPEPEAVDPSARMCSDETWAQFQSVVELVTDPAKPVRYGPGRGLWHDGKFIITHGPGRLGSKSWRSALGHTFPSFHCSSWTNFILGVLARRNEDYTHAGNIPGMFKLCTAPNAAVDEAGVGTWRGYGDICRQFLSDGSSRHRTGVPDRGRSIDMKELWLRREELTTFFVCGQSSRSAAGKWKWWHHTILFVVDHRQAGSPLFRIAADGRLSSATGWSAVAMHYRQIDEAAVDADLGKRIYRGFTVHLPTRFDRPVASIGLEP